LLRFLVRRRAAPEMPHETGEEPIGQQRPPYTDRQESQRCALLRSNGIRNIECRGERIEIFANQIAKKAPRQ